MDIELIMGHIYLDELTNKKVICIGFNNENGIVYRFQEAPAKNCFMNLDYEEVRQRIRHLTSLEVLDSIRE
jgi:hypothetical protein